MSAYTTEANKSGLTNAESTGEAIESFVSATTEALETANADESAIDAVEKQGTVLVETVNERINELEEEKADQDDVAEIEGRVEDHAQRLDGFSSWLDSVTNRVAVTEDAIEEQEGTSDPKGSRSESTLHDTIETPLEGIAALPEHAAEEELTTNQERARFIAMDVGDYTRKVPAGRAIKSSEIRKVLKAREGNTPHTETVDRVIDFLDKFGKEETKIVKRRNERRVVFSDEIVERIEEIGEMEITSSVIGNTVGA